VISAEVREPVGQVPWTGPGSALRRTLPAPPPWHGRPRRGPRRRPGRGRALPGHV